MSTSTAPTPASAPNPLPTAPARSIQDFLEHRLTAVDLKDLKGDARCCLICYDELGQAYDDKEPELPVKAPCQHVFGKACVEEWVKGKQGSNDLCPMCRARWINDGRRSAMLPRGFRRGWGSEGDDVMIATQARLDHLMSLLDDAHIDVADRPGLSENTRRMIQEAQRAVRQARARGNMPFDNAVHGERTSTSSQSASNTAVNSSANEQQQHSTGSESAGDSAPTDTAAEGHTIDH